MKKLAILLFAAALLSGCGAGLVVNVKDIQDNYNIAFTPIEPKISCKVMYYPVEPSYSGMRKKQTWNMYYVPAFVSGAVFLMDTELVVATQQEDKTVSVVFKLEYKDVVDIMIDKYYKTAGLIIKTDSKSYLIEIAKGILVDMEHTYDIYNFILARSQNKLNREARDLKADKAEETRQYEEQKAPPPSGGSTGWGSK